MPWYQTPTTHWDRKRQLLALLGHLKVPRILEDFPWTFPGSMKGFEQLPIILATNALLGPE